MSTSKTKICAACGSRQSIYLYRSDENLLPLCTNCIELDWRQSGLPAPTGSVAAAATDGPRTVRKQLRRNKKASVKSKEPRSRSIDARSISLIITGVIFVVLAYLAATE